MKLSKELLIIIVWIFIVVVIVIAVDAIIDHFSAKDRDPYNDYITKVIYNNGKERLKADEPGIYVGSKKDYIHPAVEGDTMVTYRLKGKFGYLNIVTGEEAIDSKKFNFDYAWGFDNSSGLAAVMENGKIGFIRKDGSYQIPPQYPFNKNLSDDFDCKFSDGFCVIPSENRKKFGLINTSNQLVIPFIYDYLGDLEEGYRIIGNNGKFGLLDSLSNIMISAVYDDVNLTEQGIVILDSAQHRQQLLSFDLKTVLSRYAFDDISPLKNDDGSNDEEDYGVEENEELTSDQSAYSTFTIHESMGLIRNSDGKVIIEAEWDDITYISNGIFKAELSGKYFLINSTGHIIQ